MTIGQSIEAQQQFGACLRGVTGAEVPLEGVEIEGELIGGHARVRVLQRYRNREAKPIEAIYTFPLPSDAALVGFAMRCGERRIEGVVREREEAFAEYDAAVNAGHGGALLDQERPNIFTAQVGNLLPNEETVVEVEYLQRVRADEGAIRWAIPTLVAPRYIPGPPLGDRTAHGVSAPTAVVADADRISPPRVSRAPYHVSINLVLDVGKQVAIESPSHTIRVTEIDGAPGRMRVQLTRDSALDRDVILTARGVADGESLCSVVAHRVAGDGAAPGAFALTVVPDLFDPIGRARHMEAAFLIDVSGSMNGGSLDEAKAALRLCLRHLKEGDRFNVIAFESRHRAFAAAPVPFTQQTLEQADAWVAALVANGGTELQAPLIEALASLQQGADSIVVLLTDGQVGNEQQILEAALAARGSTRVYSFGIGTASSDALLRDLARHTDGAVEFIYPGERIDEKVIAQFARAVAPRVSQIALSFEGVDVSELAPARPSALVDGEPWVVLGRYERGGMGRAIVRGVRDGAPFVLTVPIELPDVAERPTILKMWASERIRDLDAPGLGERRSKAMKERIVQMAVAHGLSTKYTSFVVIEKRAGDRRTSTPAETRVVPVNLPAGWKMFEQVPVAPPQFRVPSPMGAPPPPPGGGYGAPPPPMPSRPMAMRARQSATGAAVGQAPSGKASSYDVSHAAPAPMASMAMPRAEGAATTSDASALSSDPIVRRLAAQLASGLWPAPAGDSGDVASVRATCDALLELRAAAITTAHPIYGEPVKKAIAALIALAPSLARTDARLAQLALGVAWLLASGRRTRSQVERAIAADAAFASLRAHLSDEAAMTAHVEALRGT